MTNQLDELNRKYKKLKYLLGDLMFELYQKETIRFLYTSEGAKEEKNVKKTLTLLEYLQERIGKFEEILDEKVETVEKGKPEVQQDAISILTDTPSKAEVEEDAYSEPENLDKAEEDIIGNITSEAQEEASDNKTIHYADFIKTANFRAAKDKVLFEENVNGLKSKDVDAREKSIRNLSKISNKFVLLKLYKLALEDESPQIRLAALNELSTQPDNTKLKILTLGLKNSDNSVKSTALKDFCAIKKEDSISFLEPMLNDKDSYLRGMAITCLGLHCGQKGIDLITKLKDDKDEHVKECVNDTLNIMGVASESGKSKTSSKSKKASNKKDNKSKVVKRNHKNDRKKSRE